MMPVSKRMISMTSCILSKRIAYGGAFFNKCLQNNYSCSEWEKNGDKSVSNLPIKPQEVMPQPVDLDIGRDMVGDIQSADVMRVLKLFLDRPELSSLVAHTGVDENMLNIVKLSFKKYCNKTQNLPLSLYVILSDLIKGEGHSLDLFPYFKKHIYHVYPHLQYIEELKVIGDLQDPAKWYPLARSMKRKLFFHYGPTNSGKTHKAFQRFLEAKTGVYCAPLKLLAAEIFHKANANNVECDLRTGDEKKIVSKSNSPANHISCTVEMADISVKYEVAVIDEIQMLKCPNRGHAWTRALLGLAAEEIHLCGEAAAVNYLKEQAKILNEELECIEYKRLTKLQLERRSVHSLRNVLQGDCIVCFSKKEIYSICLKLDELKIKFAVIYGTLPPGTKNSQSDYFNNPQSGCKVLVATDAIGLGINLNIRRVIFFSVFKKGQLISVSQALQIAGRAGRYNSHYPEGFVTTFFERDLPILKSLLLRSPEELRQAGIFPLSEQIETYSYYLPELQFSDLLDVFIALAKLNKLYFMCDVTQMKLLASQLAHVNMTVKDMFLFCCAPVSKTSMSLALFTQFAKKFSMGQTLTGRFIMEFFKLPRSRTKTLSDLEMLEEAFDGTELYLWFGTRFPKYFPDKDIVLRIQAKLETAISKSVKNIIMAVKADKDKEFHSLEEEFLGKRVATSLLKEMNLKLSGKNLNDK